MPSEKNLKIYDKEEKEQKKLLKINLMMLEHVIRIGYIFAIGNEGFTDISEGVLPFATAAEVLNKDVIASEQAENALKVVSVTTAMGTNASDNLGGGERSVGTTMPDGIGDLEVDGGNERHGDTHHVR